MRRTGPLRLRAVLVVALGLAASLHVSPAYAEDGEDQPRQLRAHLDGVTATFQARYRLQLGDLNSHPLSVNVEIPRSALVTHASVIVDGTSHALSLLDPAAANAAYDALTRAPAAPMRGWAARVAEQTGRIEISVLGPRAGAVEVELEVTAPTCFVRDVRYAVIPASWTRVLARPLPPGHPSNPELATACNTSFDDEIAFVGFASPAPAADAHDHARIAGASGRLGVGADQFVRVELDLAAQMTEVPVDLATVVLVDGSRSVSASQREAQRAVVAAYLRAAPASRIQVLSYTRGVKPLLADWSAAAGAASRIDRALAALVPRNGSNVDVGLAQAGRWLERVTGTRRVVLLTDELVAHRLASATSAALREPLPAGTLVQVVALDPGRGGVTRDEPALFPDLATSSGGIAVRTGLPLDRTLDATMLVRPTTLDQVSVRAPGWAPIASESPRSCGGDPSSPTLPTTLAEGSSCTWWGKGGAGAGTVEIEGALWGTRVVRTFEPDRQAARSVARELSVMGILEAPMQLAVERLALAVNAAWSMYGAWGGRGGYADRGDSGGGTGWGAICGCDAAPTMGFGSAGVASSPARAPQAELARAVASCHPAAPVTLSLELTRDEIVEVKVAGPDALPLTTRTCIEDAVWDVALVFPSAPAHHSFALSFPAS